MKPRPEHQARQAHRRRKALGRALHQIRYVRAMLFRGIAWRRKHQLDSVGASVAFRSIRLPRLVRPHRRLLRRVFVFGLDDAGKNDRP